MNAEEFALMLSCCVPLRSGRESELSAMRLRVLLVILYRSGLRISEALDLYESDLNHNLRAIMVRHGKGDKSRLVVVDEWGWREIEYWLTVRSEIAPGYLIPVIRGELAGQRMASADIRRQMYKLRERTGMYSLQGALGHARLDVTERYLRGIDPMERLAPIAARKPPVTIIPSVRSHVGPPQG